MNIVFNSPRCFTIHLEALLLKKINKEKSFGHSVKPDPPPPNNTSYHIKLKFTAYLKLLALEFSVRVFHLAIIFALFAKMPC